MPANAQIDNSNYASSLNAGMLSDGNVFTTSSSPLQHQDDPKSQLFTITLHGFVTGSNVFQPVPARFEQKVGVVDLKSAETD